MPASSLPLAAPAAVSAAARLAYVMRHFHLVYPSAPVITVGYADSQPQVTIAEASGNFFAENNPYPTAPNWREWLGQRIPFFFDNAPAQPLISYAEGQAFVSADIISAVFYLLSGWQEYFSTERDQHGRFPYAASVQRQYGFVTLPVVNYYFDVLKTAVEYVSGQLLSPRRWGKQAADFTAFISHDIDNLQSAWKAPAKAVLRQYQLGSFGKLLWRHLTQPDAWNNLEAVANAVSLYAAKSTFFILPSARPSPDGTPNADYKLTYQLRQRLFRLADKGCELGLHGPLGTANSTPELATYHVLHFVKAPLPSGNGIRFHYLKWEPRHTQAVVETVGFDYDSTLGFAEHFGFRNSYCQPFFPFNLAASRPADFLEIPLHVMDATLHHPNYLQLAPEEILPALTPIFAEIKRFGGVASVLWHNENFDPNNTQNGPRQFHEIMRHLQQQGAAFQTGREIWQEYTTEPDAPTPNS